MENIDKNVEAINTAEAEEQKTCETFCWNFLKIRDEAAQKAKKTARRQAAVYICVLVTVFALLCAGVGATIYLGLM